MAALKKEAEFSSIETKDLKSINQTLKTKLEEVQESLKSNENLIQYLNKQLNEKANSVSGVLSGQSTQSSLGGKLSSTTAFSGTIPIGGKPPTTNTFKPSFGTIDSLST